MHDYEQLPEKDYMGTIGWSKIQCGGAQNMFGSEIKTKTPIRISITSAHVTRRESDFYVSPGDKHYVEVELTPVQWAEFLTSGNVYGGVPCTIKEVNGKRTSPVEPFSVAEVYEVATEEKFSEFQEGAKRIEQRLQNAVDSGKPMRKTEIQEILHELKCFRQNSVANVKYVKDRFKEEMTGVVAKAKAEINAYAERKLIETGVQCLIEAK